MDAAGLLFLFIYLEKLTVRSCPAFKTISRALTLAVTSQNST